MRCIVLDADNRRQTWILPDGSVRLKSIDDDGQKVIWLEEDEAEQLAETLAKAGYLLGGWTFARLAITSGVFGAALWNLLGYLIGW